MTAQSDKPEPPKQARAPVPLQVVFLTLDPGDASARVRVSDHLDGLRARGVEGELRALPRGILARRRLLRRLGEPDVVVLHRLLLSELELTWLRPRALVLDIDDAVFERPFRARPSPRLGRKLTATLRACDLVVCGSRYLRDLMRARHPRVRLLPPASAPPPAAALTPAEDDRADPRLRLVWTGSRHTLPYLESLAPVLRELVPERATLDVLADLPPRLEGIEVGFHPWTLERESQVLARADVGLYPLLDDPWSRGKCAYKVRRYMAFGLPTVASPWGGGAEALDPPRAGLVASDPQEWREALLRLADDPDSRRRIGLQARILALGRDALPERTRSLARILQQATRIGRSRAHSRLASAADP